MKLRILKTYNSYKLQRKLMFFWITIKSCSSATGAYCSGEYYMNKKEFKNTVIDTLDNKRR